LITPLLKSFYQRFIRIRGNPREIALGLALGLFIGFSPTMGAQIVMAVFLASFLKWNKFAAAIGVQITNPLTAPVIYGFTYWLGAKLMGVQKPFGLTLTVDWCSIVNMIDQAPRIFLSLIIGGGIVGVPAAMIGYIICFAIVDRYQRTLKAKVARQTETLRRKIILRKARKRNSSRSKM
jgi:uncharacterized protein (DUF2062 family)